MVKGRRNQFDYDTMTLPQKNMSGYDAVLQIALFESHKRVLMKQYYEFIEQIKDGVEVDEEAYSSLVEQINGLDNKIVNVAKELEIMKSEQTSQLRGLLEEMKDNQKLIEKLVEKQLGLKHVNEKDIKSIVMKMKSNNDIRGQVNTLKASINTYVKQGKLVTPPKPKPTKPPVVKKPKAVVEKVNAVKPNVKELIKSVFKFTNKEECLSRKKALFMSKDDIIKIIDENDDLKKIVPANYKKLTKEVLCDHLFA